MVQDRTAVRPSSRMLRRDSGLVLNSLMRELWTESSLGFWAKRRSRREEGGKTIK